MVEREQSIREKPYAHDSAASYGSFASPSARSYNSRHTATLRSAQMLGYASHFVCPQTLSERLCLERRC
jgi:hypothetical protein